MRSGWLLRQQFTPRRDGRFMRRAGQVMRRAYAVECFRFQHAATAPRPGQSPSRPRAAAIGTPEKTKDPGPKHVCSGAEPWTSNPMLEPDSALLFRRVGLEIGQGALFPEFFELAPGDGVALIPLAADGRGGCAFPSTHETGGAGNLVRTSLRPLASSRKSGTAGAQPTGLGAHLVDASSNCGL